MRRRKLSFSTTNLRRDTEITVGKLYLQDSKVKGSIQFLTLNIEPGTLNCLLRLRIDFKCFQKARQHIVGADQHCQFDDLTLAEMFLNIGEDSVQDFDLARHRVRVG